MAPVRMAITVRGIVQGVGFRPHVHRLVSATGLTGTIANSTDGVEIEVQGGRGDVEAFVRRLPDEAPPLAHILAIETREVASCEENGFGITPSRVATMRSALVAPDAATCEDCVRELFDPGDRRHLYPFINCTNCGPRYTIVRDIPYDRPQTAMSPFPLCAACRAEYEDPADRRFHAQATACARCGPRLAHLNADGEECTDSDPISAVAEALRAGQVVAIKGLGGFHLAVDATNAPAVDRLRERKRRVGKPFAVMVPDVATAAAACELDAGSEEILTSCERPIVLLPRRQAAAAAPSIVPDVAPGVDLLGLCLPNTPVHHLVFAAGDFGALVMTSGNLSEEPIAVGNDEAVSRLEGMADAFLVNDRDILLRCDDSVTRVVDGRPSPVRRARGRVPVPVLLPFEAPPVLAVGGDLKNTACITRDRMAFLSQHVGDLENLETLEFFEDTTAHLLNLLGVKPELIAHDLHPDYHSTRWARARDGARLVGVQHHHAHVAACMAEHGLEGEVLGIALDGTGYGTDGQLWGGELLAAGYTNFERLAQLEYLPLPGGEAAIREPWRMALSYLYRHRGESCLGLDIPLRESLDPVSSRVVLKMIDRGLNAPLSSGCGRLFDAVAATCGVCDVATYEAQPAIELEACIDPSDSGDGYRLELDEAADVWQIRTRPLFDALLDDLQRGVDVSAVSRRFHDGLVAVFALAATRARVRTGLSRVCLTGGTFHNVRVLRGLRRRLEEQGFTVYSHERVPTGDGGLSLGQAAVAAARWRT